MRSCNVTSRLYLLSRCRYLAPPPPDSAIRHKKPSPLREWPRKGFIGQSFRLDHLLATSKLLPPVLVNLRPVNTFTGVISVASPCSCSYTRVAWLGITPRLCTLSLHVCAFFIIFSLNTIELHLFPSQKSKAVPLHAMAAHGGRGGIAPPHT
jgi:hypothetical protein